MKRRRKLNLKSLYEYLKEVEPFSLSLHSDADGIYSSSILMDIFKVSKTTSPPFNEYNTDVAIDLGFPSNKNWTGICIDHHPDHPKDRKYKLYWDQVPTGLILYNELRDHIPKESLWKIVGSLVGDGQAERVPDEIWDMFPILLEERGYLGKGQYKLYTSAFPLFYFLSSGINAVSRLGFPLQALEIVNIAKTPLDILDNIEVRDAQEKFRMEEDSIYKSKPVVETIKNRFLIIKIHPSSSVNISSYIASKVSGENAGKTIIVINTKTGKVSLRGVLAKYVASKLNNAGFKSGGHSGFCGSYCDPDRIEEYLNIIRGL